MDASEQCKKRIYDPSTFDSRRHCTRKAVRDGYCNQHHPDSVKARDDASRKRYEEEWARKLAAQEAPAKRIAALKAACRDALAHVEAGHSMEAAQVLREALKEADDGHKT